MTLFTPITAKKSWESFESWAGEKTSGREVCSALAPFDKQP
jgi:hypothetical protein